jgi:hypothetical protein
MEFEMEELKFNKFEFVINLLFSKTFFFTTHLNIYKIYLFYWLDFWISYKIMFLLASFE